MESSYASFPSLDLANQCTSVDLIMPVTFLEEDLIITCMDMFTAGSESTSNTIEFIIMYLVLNPNVQKKLHEELDSVLQRSRRPNLDDRNRLI